MVAGVVVSLPARAAVNVDVHVGIPLPPPIVFPFPPSLVVIPETYVYAVPDIGEDIYFYNGWWWRPWNGHWYRSRNHNSGWVSYRSVPSFYSGIPSNWRDDYRAHQWRGHSWNYQRIPQQKLQNNWRDWKRNRHWENQNYWGVQGLRSRPQSRGEHPSPGPEIQQRSANPGHQFRNDHGYREAGRPQFREAGSNRQPGGSFSEKQNRRNKGND